VYIVQGMQRPAVTRNFTTVRSAWLDLLQQMNLAGDVAVPSTLMKVDCSAPLSLPDTVAFSSLLNALYDAKRSPGSIAIYDMNDTDLQRLRPLVATHYSFPDTLSLRDAAGSEQENRKNILKILRRQGTQHIVYGTAMNHFAFGYSGVLLQGALELVPGLKKSVKEEKIPLEQIARIWRKILLPKHAFSVLDLNRTVLSNGPAGTADYADSSEVLLISTNPVALDMVAFDMVNERVVGRRLKAMDDDWLEELDESKIVTLQPHIRRIQVP